MSHSQDLFLISDKTIRIFEKPISSTTTTTTTTTITTTTTTMTEPIYLPLIKTSFPFGECVLLDNPFLACGSANIIINVYNLYNGSLVIGIKGNTNLVNTLTLLDDGNFASGSADSTIKIWNKTDYSLIRTLSGHR